MRDRTISTEFGTFTATSEKRIQITKDYETSAIRSFRDVTGLIGASTVVDIGANIGVYSVYTSSLPTVSSIYAFEPEPTAFSVMKANFDLQSRSGVLHAQEMALSSSAGRSAFRVVEPMHGANALARSTDANTSVRTETLDRAVPVSGETVSVKIDVEGHEAETIKGGLDFLRRNRCYVQVEALRESRISLIFSAMKEANYHFIMSLAHDHIFIDASLFSLRDEISSCISRHLASDLAELRERRKASRKTSRWGFKLTSLQS